MKTREELNEEVKTLFDNVTKPNVFDDDWIFFFKKWQEKTRKYQDLDIEKVEFEEKKMISDNEDEVLCKKRMGFTPKRVKDGDINWFKVSDLNNVEGLLIDNPDTEEKTTMELIREQVDKKRTGRSEKLIPIQKGDILVSFKLSVGITKIYNSDKVAYCNEAIDILTVKEGIYNKYVAYNCMVEYPRYGTITNNGQTLNDEDKKNITILIPKSIRTEKKEYSSYEIQKVLVEFLEYQKQISDDYRKKLDKIDEDIKEMEENLIPAIFNQNDKYVKEMWVKWNTNPVVPRNPEDMVDFKLEDIEFEDKEIGSFTNSKSGSSEYKKEYYQKEENKGEYPLMTGSLNIVAYVKPIKESDVINEESVSYNKDNDGGSKAFYHTKPYIVGGHHYALLLKEEYKNKIMIKYFYYMLKHFFDTHMFYQSKQPVANIGLIKSKTIKIPKSIKTEKKEYSSYEVQKAIVSFIDRFYEWKKQIKEKMEILRNMLDDIDEGFLYKTFKGAE